MKIKEFNSAQSGGKKVSIADLIVLAGCAGVEKALKDAGFTETVPITPGRMDASQEQTETAPEMTVLIGGMRVLNTNFDNSIIKTRL